MPSYCLLLDRLPDPGALHRTLSEAFAVDPAGVYVGRLYEDAGGPPATVYCGYIDLDGGEFVWRLDIDTNDTVTGLPEAELATAICRQSGVKALLATEYPADEWWRLVTPEGERVVALDLDELDEERYVLAGHART
jgi:hypothetical protein